MKEIRDETSRLYSLNEAIASHNYSLWGTDMPPPEEVPLVESPCWYLALLISVEFLRKEIDKYEKLITSVKVSVGKL